jgi:hypothetical protein
LTEQTRQAVDEYLRTASNTPGDFMFRGRKGSDRGMTTRQYARLVADWIARIGLDPHVFGTHSLRRTKATLIYRRTGNLRAVQLLLGHRKIEKHRSVSGYRSGRCPRDCRTGRYLRLGAERKCSACLLGRLGETWSIGRPSESAHGFCLATAT